ncbi:MAG: hypothetical protein DRH06_11565 [Deltaproteobacteria bacterium]|nr:MAG: hypothetical protein DRH06_11565 [Deltaproteobacteria bacterium]
MGVQEMVLIRGAGVTYLTTKPIPSKSHMEVQVHDPLAVEPDSWTIVSVTDYDLIANACVFNADYNLSPYDLVNVRVADTPNELVTTPTEIGTIVGIEDEIVIVAGLEDEILEVVAMKPDIEDIVSIQANIVDVSTDPLRQSILDGYDNATKAENEATASAVSAEESLDHAGESLAGELTSESWSSAPRDTDVTQFTWNSTTDTMEEAPIVNGRSSYHWQEMAKLVASGLSFQGTWNAVDCSLPPTPTPPAGDVANGYFFIVASSTGDTTLCPDMNAGDWLVWSGDLTGDTVVEGNWNLINWTFAWDAISDVTVNGLPTVNGDDLVSTAKSDADNALQDTAIGERVTQVDYDAGQLVQDNDVEARAPTPTYPADEGLALVAREAGNNWEKILGLPLETGNLGKTVSNQGVEGDSSWRFVVSNPTNVTADETIIANGMMVSPTIDDNITVTVPDGQTFVVL